MTKLIRGEGEDEDDGEGCEVLTPPLLLFPTHHPFHQLLHHLFHQPHPSRLPPSPLTSLPLQLSSDAYPIHAIHPIPTLFLRTIMSFFSEGTVLDFKSGIY